MVFTTFDLMAFDFFGFFGFSQWFSLGLLLGWHQEALGSLGDPWEAMGSLGRLWEALGSLRKAWEAFGLMGKLWTYNGVHVHIKKDLLQAIV